MICVILKFDNAGIHELGDKHRIIQFGKESAYREATDLDRIKVNENTLHYKQVANVLRVLWGERPIPTFKNNWATEYTKIFSKKQVELPDNQVIEDIAKMSFVKIENVLCYETSSMQKNKDNAWAGKVQFFNIDGELKATGKCAPITYSLVKADMPEGLFETFMNLVGEVLGKEYRKRNMITILEELYKKRSDAKVIAFCELKNVKKYYKDTILKGEVKNFSTGRATGLLAHWHQRTVPRYVNLIKKLSGRIYLLLEDSYLDMFNKGCGVASLLEGGTVTIQGISKLNPEGLGAVPVDRS